MFVIIPHKQPALIYALSEPGQRAFWISWRRDFYLNLIATNYLLKREWNRENPDTDKKNVWLSAQAEYIQN